MKTNPARTIIHQIINAQLNPQKDQATAFAPSNIALAKYWGKRDEQLNLPITASLSVSLGDKGSHTTISLSDQAQDIYLLNGEAVNIDSLFYIRLHTYLDHFRQEDTHFRVETINTIPTQAGFASSASGYAALAKALNQLYGWQLANDKLSILARIGSGSACRSIWPGFVKWKMGFREDGMDSHGVPLHKTWPSLRIGIVKIDSRMKRISSREAMQISVRTSADYEMWPSKTRQVMQKVEQAIEDENIQLLGYFAENHALMMHAVVETARPPVVYTTEATVQARKKVWQMRRENIPVFFTQDAGPNLKLLFLEQQTDAVLEQFPGIEIIAPMLNQQAATAAR
mgnify:CR=1 FL=1